MAVNKGNKKVEQETAVKKSNRHEKNKLRQEMKKNPRSQEINDEIKRRINEGMKTQDIRSSISEKFSISKCTTMCRIKRIRKKMKIYNYGDLPVTIKALNEQKSKEMIANSISMCPSFQQSDKKKSKNSTAK